MSCFILEPKALAAIANGLELLLNRGYNYCGLEAPCSLYNALRDTCVDNYSFYSAKKIYEELYKLNQLAYNTCYKELENKEAPPIDVDKYHILTQSEYKTDGGYYDVCPGHYRYYKLVCCYVYQCSDAPTGSSALLTAMVEVMRRFATFIVVNCTEYATAPWGYY